MQYCQAETTASPNFSINHQVIMFTLASLLFQTPIWTTVQYSNPYYTFTPPSHRNKRWIYGMPSVFNFSFLDFDFSISISRLLDLLSSYMHPSLCVRTYKHLFFFVKTIFEFEKNLLIYGVIDQSLEKIWNASITVCAYACTDIFFRQVKTIFEFEKNILIYGVIDQLLRKIWNASITVRAYIQTDIFFRQVIHDFWVRKKSIDLWCDRPIT